MRYFLPLLAVVPAPAVAQDDIRFAAFGDYGTGTAQVGSYVNAKASDFIVSLGDQCYGSTPLIITQVGKPYGTWVSQGKFWPVLGNKEHLNACAGTAASLYYEYFDLPNNERYYDFVIGPVHFFALNSSSEPDGVLPTSKQGRWLQAGLAASSSPWQVVFFHHPPFSSGTTTASPKLRWPYEAWGADAVLSGHAHIYERFNKDENGDGVVLSYFISGLGGRSKSTFGTTQPDSTARYRDEYGVLFVTASATRLDFEFRNIKDAVIDTYSLVKASATSEPERFEVRYPPNGKKKGHGK